MSTYTDFQWLENYPQYQEYLDQEAAGYLSSNFQESYSGVPFASESSMRFTNSPQWVSSRAQAHALSAGYPIPEGLSEYPPPSDLVTAPRELASASSRPVTSSPAISAGSSYPSLYESREETPATYTPHDADGRSNHGRHPERVFDSRRRATAPYTSQSLQRPALTARQSRPESINRLLRQESTSPFDHQHVEQPNLSSERHAVGYSGLPRPETMSPYPSQNSQQSTLHAGRRNARTVRGQNQQATAVYAPADASHSNQSSNRHTRNASPSISQRPDTVSSPNTHLQAPSYSSYSTSNQGNMPSYASQALGNSNNIAGTRTQNASPSMSSHSEAVSPRIPQSRASSYSSHSTSRQENATTYSTQAPSNSGINTSVRREGISPRLPLYSDVVTSQIKHRNTPSFSSPVPLQDDNANNTSQSTRHPSRGAPYAAPQSSTNRSIRSPHLPQREDMRAPSVQRSEFSNRNALSTVRRTNASPHPFPRLAQLDGAEASPSASGANGYSNSSFQNTVFQQTTAPSRASSSQLQAEEPSNYAARDVIYSAQAAPQISATRPSYLAHSMSHNEGLATQKFPRQASQSQHTELNRSGSEALAQVSNTDSMSPYQSQLKGTIAQVSKGTERSGQKTKRRQSGLSENASESAPASESAFPATTTRISSMDTSSHATIDPAYLTRPESIRSHAPQNFSYLDQTAGGSSEETGRAPEVATPYSSRLPQKSDLPASALQVSPHSDSKGQRQGAPQTQNAPRADGQTTNVPLHVSQRQDETETVPAFQKVGDFEQNHQGQGVSGNSNDQSSIAQTTAAPSSAPPEDAASLLLKQFQTMDAKRRHPGPKKKPNTPKAAASVKTQPVTSMQGIDVGPPKQNSVEHAKSMSLKTSHPERNEEVAEDHSRTIYPTETLDSPSLGPMTGIATNQRTSKPKPKRGRRSKLSNSEVNETTTSPAAPLPHMQQPKNSGPTSVTQKASGHEQNKVPSETGLQIGRRVTSLANSKPAEPMQGISTAHDPPAERSKKGHPRSYQGWPDESTSQAVLQMSHPTAALQNPPPDASATSTALQETPQRKKRGRPSRTSGKQGETPAKVDPLSRPSPFPHAPTAQPSFPTKQTSPGTGIDRSNIPNTGQVGSAPEPGKQKSPPMTSLTNHARSGHRRAKRNGGLDFIFYNGIASHESPRSPGRERPTNDATLAVENNRNTMRLPPDAVPSEVTSPMQSQNLPEMAFAALFYQSHSNFSDQSYATAMDRPGQNVEKPGPEQTPSSMPPPVQKRRSVEVSRLESSTASHSTPQAAAPAETRIPQGTAYKRNRRAPNNADEVSVSSMRTSQQRQTSTKPSSSSIGACSVHPSHTPRVGRPAKPKTSQNAANKQNKRPHMENDSPGANSERNRKTPQVVVSQTPPSQKRHTKKRRLEIATGSPSADVMVVIPPRRVNVAESPTESKRTTGRETPRTKQPLIQVAVPSTPSRFEKAPGTATSTTHSERKRHSVEPKREGEQSSFEIAVAGTSSRPGDDANASEVNNTLRRPPEIADHSAHHGKDDRQSLDQIAPTGMPRLQGNGANGPEPAQTNPLKRPHEHVERPKQDSRLHIQAPHMPPPHPAPLFRPFREGMPQQPSFYLNQSPWTGQQIPGYQNPVHPLSTFFQQQHLQRSIPQSTNPPVSAALASAPPVPPQPQAIFSKYSFTPNYPNDRSYLKSRPHVVKPINPDNAAEKIHYNPTTIARDVLIASGRHPTEPPLNNHLLRLRDAFSFVELNSDLATFRWDWVDPVPTSAEHTMHSEKPYG